MERWSGRLLLIGVLAASAALIAGLGAWMAGFDAPGMFLLNGGLVLLMATPVLRVVLSIVEYARARDWRAMAAASAVLAILAASVLYASRS